MAMLHSGYSGRLTDRKGDLFFVVCFILFAFSSGFSDAFHALNLVHGGGFWARANTWYGQVAGDLFFLSDQPFARVSTGISAFVFGPFYLLLVYAFVRGANWIRIPALLYVAAMVHGMTEFLYWEFWLGPPPQNLPVFFAFNLPYLIVPLLLAIRMRKPNPFGELRLDLSRAG